MASTHWAACYLPIIVLLVILASFASAMSCAHAGDCTSGFFCHSVGMCLSCDKCSKERNNLHLCQSECQQPREDIPSTDPQITLILSTVIPAVVLVAVTVVVTGLLVRFHRRRQRMIPVMESGQDAGQSQLRPTTPCALPDHDHSSISPLLQTIQTS